MKRIGLFGGTFDPIHLGHIALVERVLADFQLNELILVPAKIPPHKSETAATPVQRYEMAQLVVNGLGDKVSVSDYELSETGISFSYKTVSYKRSIYPDDALYFIAGSDIFMTISSWEHWQQLFELSNFIVVNRHGTSFDDVKEQLSEELVKRLVNFTDYTDTKRAGDIILYSMPLVNISSVEIRSRLMAQLLPKDVYDYILKHKLYMR
ncbi:nicotinate-nucleotide adenylyltransferase [Deferribacterales bacterium RsTz2092]